MSETTKLTDATAAPAALWAGFQPLQLPEAAKLRADVEAARKLTPRAVFELSVEAGIHKPDGTLARRYR